MNSNKQLAESLLANDRPSEDRADAAQQDSAPQSSADHDEAGAGAFDPEKLRLSQNFSEEVGVKKFIATIPVKKPGNQMFFRAHPDPAYRLTTAVLEDQNDNQKSTYLVAPGLWAELASEITPVMLVTCINLDGNIFLFPAKVPDATGRDNDWWMSKREGINLAQTKWVRMQAKASLGTYAVMGAVDDLGEPEWPDISFVEILKVAFRGRYIDSLDHPVIRKLHGRR